MDGGWRGCGLVVMLTLRADCGYFVVEVGGERLRVRDLGGGGACCGCGKGCHAGWTL